MNKTDLFIKSSLLFSKNLVFALILLNIFLICISLHAQEVTEQEQDEIKLFLENVMIRDGGLYTLLGSKPMIEFDITSTLDRTEQEIADSYEELKISLKEKAAKAENESSHCVTIPTYEEYVKKGRALREKLKYREHKILWDTWYKTYGPISTPTFKLIRWERDFTAGFFIHVPYVIYTLKKHYAEFAQLTEMQFDVDTILDSIEDKSSVFWQKVFKNHYLFGLLVGYGERNAFIFDWVHKQNLPRDSVYIDRFPELSRMPQLIKDVQKKKVTVADLPIPSFISFEIHDENIERYEKEREKIIAFMKDKDLVTFVLQCLLPESQPNSATQNNDQVVLKSE